ncbi:MAG TPA: LCP family protein [Actinomycetes bacterium]|nr:LCP family protein [Actinomycetes bacterium]
MTLPDSPPSRAHRHPLLRRISIVIAVVMSVLLIGGVAAGYFIYQHLQSNITAYDPTPALGTDRPTKVVHTESEQQPLNILVMGSDTRAGQGVGFGSADAITGARSDTTLLLHLPASRDHALVVSIPRDTIVDIPDCKTDTGTYPAHTERFNAAFSIGGPACTIKTVESLTNVFIDHFVVVDFRGFEDVISALGGIDVCLPEAVNEPKSGLDLPAGVSTVTGEQALAYVRVRAIGNGSDISRIDRQQAFMSSVIDKARSTGTLLNPIKLVRFLDAATKSLTTDPALANLNELRKLAQEVQSIPPKDITFMTTPWLVNPDDPNTVVWNTPKTNKLWRAIRNDQPYPPEPPKPTEIDGSPITVPAASIPVRVLNGSGVDGAATDAAAELSAAGFNVVGIDTADSQDFLSTVIRYDVGSEDSARTLAAALDDAGRVKHSGLGTTLEVVVGKDWPGVSDFVVKRTNDSTGIRTADQNICSVE